jgi:hypothetical protein
VAALWVTLALAIASVCVGVMWKRVLRLSKIELSSVASLVERARENSGENADQARILLELDDALIDVDGATHALPELSSALARIALASGTALSLLAMASDFRFSTLPPAGACFGVGVVGAMAVSYLGRLANARSRVIRAHFTDASAQAHRQISGAGALDTRERGSRSGELG